MTTFIVLLGRFDDDDTGDAEIPRRTLLVRAKCWLWEVGKNYLSLGVQHRVFSSSGWS